MKTIDIEKETELKRVLWACYSYWQTEPVPVDQRAVCYSWVVGPYQKTFGAQFHPSKLYWLTKLGFLRQADTSRRGNRRYYTLVNPERIAGRLMEWNLN